MSVRNQPSHHLLEIRARYSQVNIVVRTIVFPPLLCHRRCSYIVPYNCCIVLCAHGRLFNVSPLT